MAVRKEDNGKWCFYGKYKQPDGTWKSYKRRGYRTKKEAKQAEAEFNPYLDCKKKRMRFKDLLVEYEKIQSRNLKKNALVTNVRNCKNHVLPVFGESYIDQIDRRQIENWKIWLEQKPLKVSSLNKIKSGFQAVMTFAVSMGYLDKNPLDKISDYKAKYEDFNDDSVHFVQISDFNRFILTVDNEMDKRLYIFLFWTGCRVSEALGLRWKDIDFNHSCFYIQWQISRDGTMIRPKTKNSIRTVDLFAGLDEMLKEMLEEAKDYPGFNNEYFVFGDIEPIKYVTFWRRHSLRNAPITIHGFRHSHATYLIQKGIDDTLIAQRLGMTVAVLRKTYAHIYDEQREKMRSQLARAFEENDKNLVQFYSSEHKKSPYLL